MPPVGTPFEATLMFKELCRRLVEATKILLGARPSTVRFDALDKDIAEACAFCAADILTGYTLGFMEQLENLSEDHERCRQVAAVILEAIDGYVNFPKADGLNFRRNLNCVPPLRQPTDIPFYHVKSTTPCLQNFCFHSKEIFEHFYPQVTLAS